MEDKIQVWDLQSFGSSPKNQELAQQGIDLLKKGAMEKGYQEGFKKGLMEASNKIQREQQEVLQNAAQILETVKQLEIQNNERIFQAILDVMLSMVNQIVKVEGRLNSEVLYKSIQEVFEVLPQKLSNYTVYLNPSDVQMFQDFKHTHFPEWEVVTQEDNNLQRGGLRLSGASVFIDASLEQKMIHMIEQSYELVKSKT